MPTVLTLMSPRAMLVLTFTLVNFVWQGAILAGLLSLLLLIIRRSGANTRYLCAVSTLAVMVLCPLITATILARSLHSGAEIVDGVQYNHTHLTFGAKLPARSLPSAKSLGAESPSVIGEWRAVLNRHSRQIVLAWLLGIIALALRSVGGWLSLCFLLRQKSFVQGPVLRLAELAHRMHVSRAPQLHVVDDTLSPMVIGTLHAVIIVPAAAILGLAPEMLDTILAHELAHIRRHDYLVNLAQCVVETALFYHPAIWWVSNRIRDERETCCDDMVVATLNDRVMYARALEGLEHIRSRQLAIAATGGSLLNRIHHILEIRTTNMTTGTYGRNKGQLTAGIVH